MGGAYPAAPPVRRGYATLLPPLARSNAEHPLYPYACMKVAGYRPPPWVRWSSLQQVDHRPPDISFSQGGAFPQPMWPKFV